jgi:ribonuclease HI
MRPQFSIYSAEQQAIITALENITQTSKPTAISTDSLSTLLAASGYHEPENKDHQKTNRQLGKLN